MPRQISVGDLQHDVEEVARQVEDENILRVTREGELYMVLLSPRTYRNLQERLNRLEQAGGHTLDPRRKPPV